MNTVEFTPTNKIHHGQNIKRLREIFGIKQEFIASELDTTQQFISKLEQKEVIDDETLEKIAKAMKLPVEAIKNLNDEATFNFIANNFHDQASSAAFSSENIYACNFNPLDKVVELYERLLDSEKDKVDRLEKLLNELKDKL
jgi:transcriptional regulator with XRE-family HTH domain